MPTASLTRRVRFSASHRYYRPEWSEGRNREIFGDCASPAAHGHDYLCEVTVTGPIDATTGFVMDLTKLDEIIRAEVTEKFDGRTLNDLPEFTPGKMIPTGENLALCIYKAITAKIPRPARVARVTVAEDETLSSTYSE